MEQPTYQPNYQPQPAQPKGYGMSIASMVLGICGLIPWGGVACAIVGLVLGILSKKQLQEQGAPFGMATAGIICSIVGLAISILWVVLCVSSCIAAQNAINSIYWDPSW